MRTTTPWVMSCCRHTVLRQIGEARHMVDTNRRRPQGAGGTPGGLGTFFLGLTMIVAGGYLLTNQVMVTSGAWYVWGYNAFGLSLLPLLLGIGLLFVNGRSLSGW